MNRLQFLAVISSLFLVFVGCGERDDSSSVSTNPGGIFVPVGTVNGGETGHTVFPTPVDAGSDGSSIPEGGDPPPACFSDLDCPGNQLCVAGDCENCLPACDGKECGSDSCGGLCGICPTELSCEESFCVCVVSCGGQECGDDGCGGVCGVCPETHYCSQEGGCVALPLEICDNGLDDDFDWFTDCDDTDCEDAFACTNPGFDCSQVSDDLLPLVKLNGPMASEDLAFDAEGNVVGSNDQAIFKSSYGGNPVPWVPNIYFRAGMRYLPTGDLVVCNDNKGQLIRVDSDGVQHVMLSGLAYPNGLTVDLDGLVYFTEHDAHKVWQVEPYTGEKVLVASGITNANGVGFSPDYKTLYIGGFSGVGTIYTVAIHDDGTFGSKEAWAKNVGSGWLDGIGVDICGNVYICDYGQTTVYRVSPGGKTKKLIIDGSVISGTYLPNMQWGAGLGGWDELKLYLPDGWKKGVFEVDLGIPPTVRPYP